MSLPIIDLHCDLLSYLTRENTTFNDTAEIGCALPDLQQGNVKLQVMAIFAPTQSESAAYGLQQAEIFRRLADEENEWYALRPQDVANFGKNSNVGMLAAIENGSAFCDENTPLKQGFENLERLLEISGPALYIGFTHHAENRFGGGNFSSAGLKNDGMALLDYLHGRNIAVDFSHTSDALAYGILDYIVKQNLDISMLASHSNYRSVYGHARNLPDELAQEIIHRKGLIGLNFVRAFVNPDHEEALADHLAHGINLGGEHSVCYGADYFYTKSHPDKSRIPFYFPAHESAARYPELTEDFAARFGARPAENLSFENALHFMRRLWSL